MRSMLPMIMTLGHSSPLRDLEARHSRGRTEFRRQSSVKRLKFMAHPHFAALNAGYKYFRTTAGSVDSFA
jgi:hypothetical protein